MPSGQTGIRLREALVAGDVAAALVAIPHLDEAHRVEILLGAALRDAREGHRSAALFLEATASGDWPPLVERLVEPPDDRLDRLAVAYLVEGRVPERWRPDGLPLGGALRGPEADVAVAEAYASGVAGLALVDFFADLPLHAAVSHYYRVGSIHALGPRPLLILAASDELS
jgi:hypothetical protein